MDHIHAFSSLGPPLVGAHSHQAPMHHRRRSSTVAGLDIEEFRQAKARRQSILNEAGAEGKLAKEKGAMRFSNLQRHDSIFKPTATKPAVISRLLSLPAELRNKIYTHLFECDPPLIKPTYTFPGILLTCRQIFHEAIGLYYSATPFRCLDESSTISWLTTLPKKYLELIPEVRYDTRWIIFSTPLIPVPGTEGWLFRQLIERLEDKGLGVDALVRGREEDGGWRKGRLKVSFYSKKVMDGEGNRNGILWTDDPGWVESVTEAE